MSRVTELAFRGPEWTYRPLEATFSAGSWGLDATGVGAPQTITDVIIKARSVCDVVNWRRGMLSVVFRVNTSLTDGLHHGFLSNSSRYVSIEAGFHWNTKICASRSADDPAYRFIWVRVNGHHGVRRDHGNW